VITTVFVSEIESAGHHLPRRDGHGKVPRARDHPHTPIALAQLMENLFGSLGTECGLPDKEAAFAGHCK